MLLTGNCHTADTAVSCPTGTRRCARAGSECKQTTAAGLQGKVETEDAWAEAGGWRPP